MCITHNRGVNFSGNTAPTYVLTHKPLLTYQLHTSFDKVGELFALEHSV